MLMDLFRAPPVVIIFQHQFQLYRLLASVVASKVKTSLCQGGVLTYVHPHVHHAGYIGDTSCVNDIWAHQGTWAVPSVENIREPTACISDTSTLCFSTSLPASLPACLPTYLPAYLPTYYHHIFYSWTPGWFFVCPIWKSETEANVWLVIYIYI